MIDKILYSLGIKKVSNNSKPEMKYLIAGLGNIGAEYQNTRHNIGFDILDYLAKEKDATFEDGRYGMTTRFKHKARVFVLLKPSTYVNLSGRAINYWLKKEKIPVENLLVIADDLALTFGTLRLKAKGSDAGHNGLKSIQQNLGHNKFARLRFGIGNEYKKGDQVNFVIGEWDESEKEKLPERIDKAAQIVTSYGTIGVTRTMNLFNNK
ncbi:aminoacyl-tRNA hydrolase [Marinilabiliaceae bacterium ANBcel2]|nr:aminoacyl-tRNA hydrolase [Marinilabiliaceae bacterium ANBcel2]